KLKRGQQVLLVDRLPAHTDRTEGGFVDQVGQIGAHGARGGQGDFLEVHILGQFDLSGVDVEGGQSAGQVGPVNGNAPVKAAGTEEGLVQHLRAVGGAQDDN